MKERIQEEQRFLKARRSGYQIVKGIKEGSYSPARENAIRQAVEESTKIETEPQRIVSRQSRPQTAPARKIFGRNNQLRTYDANAKS